MGLPAVLCEIAAVVASVIPGLIDGSHSRLPIQHSSRQAKQYISFSSDERVKCQSRVTLSSPIGTAVTGFSVTGFFQARLGTSAFHNINTPSWLANRRRRVDRCKLSPCLHLYVEYIMQNVRLDEFSWNQRGWGEISITLDVQTAHSNCRKWRAVISSDEWKRDRKSKHSNTKTVPQSHKANWYGNGNRLLLVSRNCLSDMQFCQLKLVRCRSLVVILWQT